MKSSTLNHHALLTDLYQLTMGAAYLDNGKADEVATFEMFIRSLPSDWGYFVAAGVDEALETICELRFTEEDIGYLRETGLFKSAFLGYLEQFRFTGDIYAIQEGTPFTAETPIIRVTAPRPEAQLIETILLNTVNFQTMIASKASRIINAAGKAKVIDFGLRRAHGGDASIMGARSAYLAGAIGTSNVEAAKRYCIPPSGTMAHSYVMGYDDELESFRDYAKTFPKNTVLLIDTYDTIEGAKKAVQVAKEMKAKGEHLLGVRLDSGELEGLAEQVRCILDEAGLEYVMIVLSSDLNEYKINKYTKDQAPVDFYGVGTELITAKPVAALSGVYKLVEDNLGPRIKLSESKRTYPGRKQVYRISENGLYQYDVLELEDQSHEGTPLLSLAVKDGKIVREKPYELKIGVGLERLTEQLVEKYSKNRLE